MVAVLRYYGKRNDVSALFKAFFIFYCVFKTLRNKSLYLMGAFRR